MSSVVSLDDPRLEITAMRIKLLAVEGSIGSLRLAVLVFGNALTSSRAAHRQEPDAAEFLRIYADIQLNQATAALVAASTIFAHAVCEGVLMDLCRLTARLDPNAWYPRIRFKKVSVEDLEDRASEEIKGELLEGHLSELQKKPLLTGVWRILRNVGLGIDSGEFRPISSIRNDMN